jgi:hypothetical protein
MVRAGECLTLALGAVGLVLGLYNDWPFWLVALLGAASVLGIVLIALGHRRRTPEDQAGNLDPTVTFDGDWKTLEGDDIRSSADRVVRGSGDSLKMRRVRHRPKQ